MAINKRAVRPSAAKASTKKSASAEADESAVVEGAGPFGEIRITRSVTRKSAGDDHFVSVGLSLPFDPAGGDKARIAATKKVTAAVTEQLTEELEALPDSDEILAGDDTEEDEAEDEAPKKSGKKASGKKKEPEPEEDEEDAEEDEDAEDDESEDEELTEEDVLAMDVKELKQLVKEEGLEDIDTKLSQKKLAKAVWEALEAADDEDAEDDDEAEDDESEEDADEDGEDDDAEEEDEAEDDESPYTQKELMAMKLEGLQDIVKEWKIAKKVKVDKDAPLNDKKKAYAKAILAEQGE